VTKRPITGESTKETVKTIRAGSAGMSGEPVVTNLRVFYFYTQGCGCAQASGIPCALCFREGRYLAMTRENRAAGRKTCVWNRDIYTSTIVITGLVPVIHVLLRLRGDKVVDGRVIGKRKRRRSSNGYARP
jgi:hypothetical protein